MPYDDPIDQIQTLLAELRSRGLLAPVCLGTVAADGSPNSRFVDCKEVRNGAVLFATDGRSVKAHEFDRDMRVSLAAWWEPLQVQLRVLGTVAPADDAVSERIFAERSRSAKALAVLSSPNGELLDPEGFHRDVEALAASGRAIERPPHWKVYAITPAVIEILRFSKDRIHVRTRYVTEEGRWNAARLAP